MVQSWLDICVEWLHSYERVSKSLTLDEARKHLEHWWLYNGMDFTNKEHPGPLIGSNGGINSIFSKMITVFHSPLFKQHYTRSVGENHVIGSLTALWLSETGGYYINNIIPAFDAEIPETLASDERHWIPDDAFQVASAHICDVCGKPMVLVDSDEDMGKMYHCVPCNRTWITLGRHNSYDHAGWQ